MQNPTRPHAYSYIRFSTPDQLKGDSLRRQTEAAVRYAALHGLDLQEATYDDLGVSAYRGANAAETGRLREFLQAVEYEDIPRGSYLLVESLDRISRQKPRKAVRLLEEICEAGITVVTLNDGRSYTEDNLDNDSWSLMGAMMIAIRAHEESETKARRLKEAWANKRKNAGSRPLTSKCPGWLRLRDDRSGFDVLPERAAIVRQIFDMTLNGIGQHTIATSLNREGVPVFGRGRMWQRSYICKMLADASVIGTFTPNRVETVNGRKVRTPTEPVEDYYPAVVPREKFEQVQAGARGRGGGSKAGPANILGGLAKCPECGATMTRINKGGKKGGRPYLVCTVAKAGAGCTYRQVKLGAIQDAIIGKADEFLASLPAPDGDLTDEQARLQAAIDELGDEIENLTRAIAASGHSPALLATLSDREAHRDEMLAELEEVEVRIADILTNRVQETAAKLADALKSEPADVAQINATMRQLFGRVVVDYVQGQLWFHWKHSDEAMAIMYAWPQDL